MAAATKSSRGRSSLRRRAGALIDGFVEHDLLTSASAVAFRILFALVPFVLFALALLSFLQFGDLWRLELGPRVAPFFSPAGFGVINETVEQILASRQAIWLSTGAVIAVWEVSSGVRAIMGAVKRVYCVEADRSFFKRMFVSVMLALGIGTCFILSALVLRLGILTVFGELGVVLGVLDFLLRWAVGIALLMLAVGLLMRYGTVERQSLPWVSFGSGLTVALWILASLAFVWYLTSVAPYATIFGSLATFIALMTYLYISSVAFMAGVQIDALVRQEVDGTPSGD